jgi:thiol-disulfide isomerase/thioredoxin
VTRRFALALVLLAACSRSDPEPRPDPQAQPQPSASATAPTGPLVLARGVRIDKAKDGADAAKVVREARAAERADGRDLVVYVGAKWCEPCQRFHKAAAAGQLDDAFPQLTLLEFDLDQDRDRLDAAGYHSDLIPLFVMPGDDGRASSKRFEGSVKGDGATANITPRLRALLTR